MDCGALVRVNELFEFFYQFPQLGLAAQLLRNLFYEAVHELLAVPALPDVNEVELILDAHVLDLDDMVRQVAGLVVLDLLVRELVEKELVDPPFASLDVRDLAGIEVFERLVDDLHDRVKVKQVEVEQELERLFFRAHPEHFLHTVDLLAHLVAEELVWLTNVQKDAGWVGLVELRLLLPLLFILLCLDLGPAGRLKAGILEIVVCAELEFDL